jgi:hypothetical protein
MLSHSTVGEQGGSATIRPEMSEELKGVDGSSREDEGYTPQTLFEGGGGQGGHVGGRLNRIQRWIILS